MRWQLVTLKLDSLDLTNLGSLTSAGADCSCGWAASGGLADDGVLLLISAAMVVTTIAARLIRWCRPGEAGQHGLPRWWWAVGYWRWLLMRLGGQ